MDFSWILLKAEGSDQLTFWEVIKNVFSIILTADYLAVILSVIALCLSFRAEHRYSKKLDCKISVIPIRAMYAIDVNNNKRLDPFITRYNYLINVFLINPSSAPISFFNLDVISSMNKLLPFPVKSWVDAVHFETVCCLTTDPDKDTHPIRLIPPSDVYGTLPSHSCLPMMLAIQATPNSTVRLSFKSCKTRPFKSKDPTTTYEYKTNEYLIDLSSPTNIIKLTGSTKIPIKKASRNGKFVTRKVSWRKIKREQRDARSKEDGSNI